jgi:hypothetical protein
MIWTVKNEWNGDFDLEREGRQMGTGIFGVNRG